MENLMTSSTWLPRRPRSTRSPDHSFEVSRLLIQDRHFKCKEDNTLMMKKRQSRMLMMTRRWLNRLHFEKNTTFFSFISKKEYNVKSRKCNFYCWINKTCKKWNDPSTENASSIWIQTPLKKSRGENQEQTSQTTSTTASLKRLGKDTVIERIHQRLEQRERVNDIGTLCSSYTCDMEVPVWASKPLLIKSIYDV